MKEIALQLICLLTTVHAGCLKQSEVFVGIDEGTQISNLSEIQSINESGYHLHQMTTCEDSTGDLIGIQFTLAIHDDDSPKCPEDGNTCFESSESWSTFKLMEPLGNLSGTCQTLTLSGQIDAIRAYYNESTRTVKSVQYFKDTTKKTYGEMGSPYEQWNFGDDNILLGLYGYTDGAVIKSLGFISLD